MPLKMDLPAKCYTVCLSPQIQVSFDHEGRRELVHIKSEYKLKANARICGGLFLGIDDWCDFTVLLPSIYNFVKESRVNYDLRKEIWPCPARQVWTMRGGHAAFFESNVDPYGKLIMAISICRFADVPKKKPTHYLKLNDLGEVTIPENKLDDLIMVASDIYDNLLKEHSEMVPHAHTLPYQYPFCTECAILHGPHPLSNPLTSLKSEVLKKYSVKPRPFV